MPHRQGCPISAGKNQLRNVLVCQAARIFKYILYILEGGRKHAHFSADLSRGR